MKLIHVFETLLAVTVVGCAVSAIDTDETSSEDVGATSAAVKPGGLDTVPAYFNYDNRYSVADDANRIYAHFNSYRGKRITVDLHQREAAYGASVSLKLYEVSSDGSLRFLNTVEDHRGSAVTSFRSRGTGSYVVELASSGHLADLELSLYCNSGSCSPDRQPGEVCGGVAGLSCAEGLYCEYPPEASCGAGDQSGICSVKPALCDQIESPVCGCNGQTYRNACAAALVGVSVKSDGECKAPIANVGESCGGFTRGPAPVCAEGLYCSYLPGDFCGWADAPGKCAEKPVVCDTTPAPVCGCDGKTYENACFAAAKGAAVNHLGECEKPGTNH